MDISPEDERFPGHLLHLAALWDNAELVDDLVSGNSNLEINTVDDSGRTALHAAAACENSRCLPLLIKYGADPNLTGGKSGQLKTPLHIAAEKGDVENIKVLLSAGANWNLPDESGFTPLDVAERNGHLSALKALCDFQDEQEKILADHHAKLRTALASGTPIKELLDELGPKADLIVNMAPAGANTLLFTAAEMGLVEAVRTLIAAGSDGRSHPVTKYSPLYIACYHGNKSIAETLLLHFPEMIKQQTFEKWLPIHACCIRGHVDLVSLLLEFPYPENLLTIFQDVTGEYEYQAAFDVNHRDVSGQTALYVACRSGNKKIVDILLSHTRRAVKISTKNMDENLEVTSPTSVKSVETSTVVSPTRRKISHGIQSIMSKLNLGGKSSNSDSSSDIFIKPVHLDTIIGTNKDTCLQVAIRGRHTNIVQTLLEAGADPNVPLNLPAVTLSERVYQYVTETTSSEPILSALTEACKRRNYVLVDLLLKYGATDINCLAIREAADIGDEGLIARLLAIKAYPDPEYKINKRGMTENMSINGLLSPSSTRSMDKSPPQQRKSLLTYSSMFPSQSAMINWRNQSGKLTSIKMSWIQDAALHVNPKLRGSLRGQSVALHAVTRIDLSANSLNFIPLQLFQMISLRYLNVSNNKLEKLPTSSDADNSCSKSIIKKNQKNKKTENIDEYYTAPVLEEVYLQGNRLEYLPNSIFFLPSLTTLDVSNNKLTKLPYAMWKSPRLRDFNVALNLLKDLPTKPEHVSLIDEVSSNPLSPTNNDKDKSMTPSNSSNQLSSSSNNSKISSNSSTSSVKRRSWSVDRASNSRQEGYRNSISESDIFTEESLPYIKKVDTVLSQDLRKHHLWTRGLEVAERPPDPPPSARFSRISIINLAHNQFTSIPAGLPCLAPVLSRLNMSYNALRSMSYITSYPSSLKQLDLSHNKISCWPSLPQVDSWIPLEQENLTCYCPGGNGSSRTRARSAGGVRKAVLAVLCPAKRHLRLDGLRTLVLADNLLTRIQLTTDDDGRMTSTDDEPAVEKHHREVGASTDDEDDWNIVPVVRSRLLFPNLSMLDISNNSVSFIPPTIHELSNLSVLNISGNSDISQLPPQMGLLSRLWNLNTNGCSLQEPLRSMIDSKKYKTMDIIGYLKSVLEDAKPYARMKLMVVGIQGIGKTTLLECLRKESAPGHRKKPPEHWTKRMGNKNVKTSKGVRMSTVGVDIGDWVYKKHSTWSDTSIQVVTSAHGPVVFRTWDFGGQKEYYATHQYFLSRRSLYIVVWKITDGLSGLEGIQHWLVSIQARAPNSPVIIVGTHYDIAIQNAYDTTPQQLQRIIQERYILISDPEKRGLPRVLDTVEVSCSTRHNIRLLCNLIYDTVFSLRQSGSKELLLEQRVPALYLALEDIVGIIAAERKNRGLDPVLTHDQFKHQVSQYMLQKHNRVFRDHAELHQATMFLHDNGVLLHYDDATLKDLYFLDPQWLCDMLAHVVTVREINPFAKSGIMRLEDLQLLFKSLKADDSRDYVVSLLNKFEVALCWDGRSLLLPSLLPANEPSDANSSSFVKIPMKTRAWTGRGHKKIAVSPLSILNKNVDGIVPSGAVVATNVPYGPIVSACTSHGRPRPNNVIRRLLVASYSPCGFWPRLITRLLADDGIPDIVESFYPLPDELTGDSAIMKITHQTGEWWPWQTGLRLVRAGVPLLTLREVQQDNSLYRNIRFKLKQEGIWYDVDSSTSSIIEVLLPTDEMIIKKPISDEQGETIGFQNITLEPSIEAVSKLLVTVVDHIDTLLEDWYPTLGTRFVHTSEGRYLVTRLVPCPKCLTEAEFSFQHSPEGAFPGNSNNPGDSKTGLHLNFEDAFKRPPQFEPAELKLGRPRASQESCMSDGDSGVGPDSNSSSRMPSVEGIVNANSTKPLPSVYAWTVEECILLASSTVSVECPTHREMTLNKIAPDVIFLDLGPHRLASGSDLIRENLIGRGAFGSVFKAEWKDRGPVAMKVLQPVPPNAKAPASALAAYKAAIARWERDPPQAACRAYLLARAEMGVLFPLHHPNVAPLLAACTSPLALVLALAPMGALDGILRGYRQSGAKLGPHCAQAVAIQAARALEYLHRQRVIYRDLKAENVLVWEMPPPVGPFKDDPGLSVHIKVADYGISRTSLPTGTKGFGGTEGFMAPEIMRYNGEEEYTEKVDCFSFGMFLYELLTLRQPFEGHEAVKECVLEGGRPALTHKETYYPCYMLDLMVACWSGQPEQRPSASQIVSIASAPEFTHLADVASLQHTADASFAATTESMNVSEGAPGWEVWVARQSPKCDIVSVGFSRWLNYHVIPLPSKSQDVPVDESIVPTALCSVGTSMWMGDSLGRIHAYNASDCHHIFTYSMETNNKDCRISALYHLPSLARVAAALSNGRLFLLDNSSTPLSSTAGEGIFVMTELGTATSLFCLTAVTTPDFCELWCGGDSGGVIHVYKLVAGVGAAGAQEIPRPQSVSSTTCKVTHAVAQKNTVCTYLYPGCVIYQWDAFTKTLLAKLDCSKLVPCSESLRSISIEEHLTPGLCQVSSLAALNDEIYIGTTWGCIIIVENESLTPITIFRPYEEEVKAIIPLPQNGEFKESQELHNNDLYQEDDTPLIATIGKGYRNLLARYSDLPYQTTPSQNQNTVYCLLWRAEHWAAN